LKSNCPITVKQIYLFDFADKLVERARDELTGFKNIAIYTDQITSMNITQTEKYADKVSKVLVGSVLQYLGDYRQIEKSLVALYNSLQPGTKILCTHNPDTNKKEQFIESYYKLDWPKAKIKKSIEYEKNERFWMDYNECKKLAVSIGFEHCEILAINPLLFQAGHMFDFLLVR
jgi:hypothetical protein